MGEIKSMWEIVSEKVKDISETPAEKAERERKEHILKGSKLAAKFLKDDDFDLMVGIEEYKGDARKYVTEGAQFTLLANIVLPRNEVIKEENKRPMEGIWILKKDKDMVRDIFYRIEELFTEYRQAAKRTHDRLKHDFEVKTEEVGRALEKELGLNVEVDVEHQPEFDRRWREVLNAINSRYIEGLNMLKEKLSRLKFFYYMK
jgi:hypothetical protein